MEGGRNEETRERSQEKVSLEKGERRGAHDEDKKKKHFRSARTKDEKVGGGDISRGQGVEHGRLSKKEEKAHSPLDQT